MNEITTRVVARWETKGKDWLELYSASPGYFYRGNGCGGNLQASTNDAEAVQRMESGPVSVLRMDRPSLHRVKNTNTSEKFSGVTTSELVLMLGDEFVSFSEKTQLLKELRKRDGSEI